MILSADIILSNANDGKPGEDGKSGVSLFKSYAFRRTDSDISGQQPTGGTWDNPVPTGWSDGGHPRAAAHGAVGVLEREGWKDTEKDIIIIIV